MKKTVTRLLYVYGEEYAAMMFEDDYNTKDRMIMLADDLEWERTNHKTKYFDNYDILVAETSIVNTLTRSDMLAQLLNRYINRYDRTVVSDSIDYDNMRFFIEIDSVKMCCHVDKDEKSLHTLMSKAPKSRLQLIQYIQSKLVSGEISSVVDYDWEFRNTMKLGEKFKTIY